MHGLARHTAKLFLLNRDSHLEYGDACSIRYYRIRETLTRNTTVEEALGGVCELELLRGAKVMIDRQIAKLIYSSS